MTERAVRIASTALCFAAFGVSGLAFGLVVAPILYLVVWRRERRERIARRVVRNAFRTLVWSMKGLRILTADVATMQAEQLAGRLIAANHPTYIDIVFLLALVPDAVCVFKRSILRNPVMLGPVRVAGYLVNDDGQKLVANAARALAAGSSLIVFPEGTRSEAGGRLQPFQRGAAHVAIAAKVPIHPVAIRCEPPMLVRGQAWHRLPGARSHFIFERLAPIDPRPAEPAPSEARRLTSELRTALERALGSVDGAPLAPSEGVGTGGRPMTTSLE